MTAVENRHGGPWTGIKLEVLQQYLYAFNIALKDINFERIYIDGFAGTGVQTSKNENGEMESRDGSARIALKSEPQFARHIFIEKRPSFVKELEKLKFEFPNADIEILNEDANHALPRICHDTKWGSTGSNNWGKRAVLFLDPFGMQVDWQTLKIIAKTNSIDVWYLFPSSALVRNAAKKFSAVDGDKDRAITRMLGTEEWKDAFYEESDQIEMFSNDPERVRIADVKIMERYVKNRLQNEGGFAKVLDPLPIDLPNGPRLFSLFFAVSNPSPRAIALSTKLAKHILDHAY